MVSSIITPLVLLFIAFTMLCIGAGILFYFGIIIARSAHRRWQAMRRLQALRRKDLNPGKLFMAALTPKHEAACNGTDPCGSVDHPFILGKFRLHFPIEKPEPIEVP